MEEINRREALRRAAWIMGGALSAPTIAGILNGCTPQPELTWQPSFFTEDQAKLVMEIAEGIIPETNTPGAKSLGVPQFIETMVSTVYNEKTRAEFVDGLTAFEATCKSEMGAAFVSLGNAEKEVFLKSQNDTIFGLKFVRGEKDRPFFWRVKELTLVGYYTTEHGATKELQYVAIPVELKGCIPLSEAGNGKTWAT